MSQAVHETIRELERRRVAALLAADIEALDALLTDDLVHIHGTGKIDDKAEYLDGVKNKYRFLMIERGDLNIRVYGNVAVAVGPLSQTVNPTGTDREVNISAIVTQTWLHDEAGWRQSTCHTGFLSKS